jgi:hypothetical protein
VGDDDTDNSSVCLVRFARLACLARLGRLYRTTGASAGTVTGDTADSLSA